MLYLKAMATQISLSPSLIGSKTGKIKSSRSLKIYFLNTKKSTLVRTLRCHSVRIEDLFSKDVVRKNHGVYFLPSYNLGMFTK